MINEEELKREKSKLLARIRVIEKQLSQSVTRMSLEEISEKVEYITGVDVKNIGKRCKKDAKIAKQIFCREGFNQGWSSPQLSKFCGDSSRFTALASRYRHIDSCNGNWDVKQQWLKFKKYAQEN